MCTCVCVGGQSSEVTGIVFFSTPGPVPHSFSLMDQEVVPKGWVWILSLSLEFSEFVSVCVHVCFILKLMF